VLHGVDSNRVLTELSLTLGKHGPFGDCGNSRPIRQIRAPKEDTGSGYGWPERQTALGSEMKTDSLQRDGSGDCTAIHPANIAKLSQARDLLNQTA